jgi:hypothetical protein
MATVVFIHRLQPADGKRDALIGLLREFADSINADPECLHYSVHEPIDDEATPLTVIQAHTLWRHAVDMTLNSHTVPEVNPDRQPLPSTTVLRTVTILPGLIPLCTTCPVRGLPALVLRHRG